MPGYPETFEGFRVRDHKKWSDFKKEKFEPKKFDNRDVDIEIECCGVCGSDVHTITGGWGDAPLPLAVGHEVVGRAVKVGPEVSTVKVGDRVGVGAQVWADLTCRLCKEDQENYCPKMINTYGSPYPDGYIAQGGFASHIRAHEYFVFPIPDNIKSSDAAPLMCAGLTVYSPLKRANVGPGKKVGVVGIGGLGHLAIMLAKALGAEVYALSHSPNKEADAKKLGAKEFIVTGEENWHEKWAFTFDFLLNTADATQHFDLAQYMSTVNVNGEFHHVGLPDEPLPQIKAQAFAANGAKMSGSHIGNRPEMLSLLKLVSEKNLAPMVETIPISEKGCAEAVERVNKNQVHYRFTLTDFDKAFGTNPK